jgi:hypothetical protein
MPGRLYEATSGRRTRSDPTASWPPRSGPAQGSQTEAAVRRRGRDAGDRRPRLARWQDRFAGAWRLFVAGCHCNRDTAATIEASPLRIEELERAKIARAMPLVRQMIVGAARLAE